MKKLSKSDADRKSQYLRMITEAMEAVQKAAEDLIHAKAHLNAKVRLLNGAIEAAEGWREDLHGEMEAYADERSEAWQESDAASEHADWRNEWDNELPAYELPEDLMQTVVDVDEAFPVDAKAFVGDLELPEAYELLVQFPDEVG